MMRLNVLSCGAGVQSTTLALLACNGDLPGLDAAVFADTGWEPAQVYRQVDRIEAELAKVGVPLHRVSKGNLRNDHLDPLARFASVPYYTLAPADSEVPVREACEACDGSGRGLGDEPDCSVCEGSGSVDTDQMRVATRAEREGMARRQCTSEYKLGPIMRKCRELLGAAAPDFRRVPKGNTVVQWIGFSTDEIHRVNDRRENRYSEKRYPLLELGMSRKDCQRYLERAGWGDTAKSACIGCPFHGNAHWREMRDRRDICATCGHHRDDHWRGIPAFPGAPKRCAHLYNPPISPDDETPAVLCKCTAFRSEWDDAVEFDRAIRKGGARGLPLNGEAFLHRSRVPLDQAPIDRVTPKEWADRQYDIFDVPGEWRPGWLLAVRVPQWRGGLLMVAAIPGHCGTCGVATDSLPCRSCDLEQDIRRQIARAEREETERDA